MSDAQRISALLREADRKGLFLKHRAQFASLSSIRPTVTRSPAQIVVKVSKRLKDMPDEAMREMFEQVLKRIDDPDLPRFGPRGVAYLQSERFVKVARRDLNKDPRFVSEQYTPRTTLTASVKRVAKMLPDPALQIHMAHLDIRWRKLAFSLDDEYIASTDPLAQVIKVDSRLARRGMPTALLDYVVYRELCVLCSYDYPYGRVDPDLYARLAERFPDHERMEAVCRDMRWAFTIPLEGE